MTVDHRKVEVGGQTAEFARWPRYRAAQLGFAEHWYPVARSRQLRRRSRSVTILGQDVFLKRDRGRVYALHDRCTHWGIPLSRGRQVFPGTFGRRPRTGAWRGWSG